MDMGEAWPAMTEGERQEVVRLTLDAVAVDVAGDRVEAVAPRPSFAPIFSLAAEAIGVDCAWRPRADSNRRSPP